MRKNTLRFAFAIGPLIFFYTIIRTREPVTCWCRSINYRLTGNMKSLKNKIDFWR